MSMDMSMNADKRIKPGSRAHRAMHVERAIDPAARTISLAFSSETPYQRWWGIEILDHAPESVRLDRLKAGAPLLIDHDNSIRSQVGIIEAVEIGADRVGRAVARLGTDVDAEMVWRKIEDGIVRNVSVGYVIHDARLVESKDGVDTWRVTDWEPLEISLVAVPADATVGIGRAAADERVEIIQETVTMPEIEVIEQARREAAAAARAEESRRVAEIVALGELHARHGGDKLAAEAIRSGDSVDAFRAKLLDKLAASQPVAEIGMSDKEAKRFSFLRAINALANPSDRQAYEAAAFEREASQAVAAKLGRAATGFYVPLDVLRRDMTVGTPSAGGHTVATDLLAESFIDLLRNRMVVAALGARVLAGLAGNVAIPRQTGGAAAYWVAEGGAPTESQAAFDQVALTPKTVGAYTDISRKLLLQSSLDIEAFVRADLAATIALEIDRVAINGSGAANQPRGILNTSGIGDVGGGANGAAPTLAHIIALETDVSVANADVGNLAYLTNAKVRGVLKSTERWANSGMPVWGDGAAPLNGYRAAVSNQIPSNLDKGTSVGVCSAIIFGNWSDLIIGQWGALDLTVDPYTGSTSGTVRVIALQDVDVAVRHPESFSAMKDALTA